MAKKKSRAPVSPKSFMRPEWRRKIYGEGGPKQPPPRTVQEAAERRARTKRSASLPWWLKAFEDWIPTQEQLTERERREGMKRPLSDVIVPTGELEYIERMKEKARSQAHAPPTYGRPGAGPTPSAEPRSRYGPPPPAARPRGPFSSQGQGHAQSPVSVFDLPSLWEGLRRVRSNPRFRGSYGVGQISREGRTQAERAIDVAEFFKVSDETLRQYRPETLWAQWAELFLKSVADELNHLKPSDIPGRLKFDLVQDGAFGLVYVE